MSDPWDDLGGHQPEHAPTPAAPGGTPTCPVCGQHGTATRINHPNGTYYCSCGSLFHGTDTEWRRWAHHRRMATERTTRPPLKLQPRPIPRGDT